MSKRNQFNRRVITPLVTRWRALPEPVRRYGTLVAVLIVGVWLGNVLFSETQETPSDAEIMADDGQAVEFWTCSMHPQVRQDGPGPCPFCGMDLIPVRGGHDHGSMEQVSISEHAAALMSIQVRPVERRREAGEVMLSGRLDYDERMVNDVILRTEGQVERLYVNFTNAPVSRGQRLADIYSPAILSASQELLQARQAAERGGMRELADAARTQLVQLGVSEAQIQRIIETGEPARTYTLFAPAGGVVTELSARQGEWLASGARLMQIGGVGQVWAQFEAYESDLGRLRTGQDVRFTVESFPGEAFQGTVAFIDPVVDGARRTARVRVQVPNPSGRLRPGMLIRGRVAASRAASAEAPLLIPATAPLITGTRALVYVQLPHEEAPTFVPREITLGSRAGDFFEVASGLEEGELVVIHGAFRLDSELQIRGGRSMMNPDGARPAGGHDHGETLPIAAEAASGDVELGDVVRAYLAITDALVASDASRARAAAERMDRALGGVDSDNRDWRRQRGQLSAPLAAMQRAGSDLEAIRTQLQPLSDALATAASRYGSSVTLHRARCPMAFGNQGGTWLQSDPTSVANPYFGDAMLTCGTVEHEVAG
jgi:membrane fusion protein, copper/silver efflux system